MNGKQTYSRSRLNFDSGSTQSDGHEIYRPETEDFQSSSKQSLFCQNPYTAHMSNYADRLASFETWPGNIITPKEVFALAGFFYLGFGDKVKCFHCNGGLQHWRPEDQPWFEHAKWFPDCSYVLQYKGKEFVESITRRYSSLNRPAPSHQQFPQYQPTQASPPTTQEPSRSISFSSNSSNNCDSGAVSSISCANSSISNLNVANDFSTSKTMRMPAKKLTKEFPQKKQKNVFSDDISNMTKAEIDCKVKKLLDERTCKVCLDETTNCLFLPCRHLCSCINCASALRKCPMCREKIEKILKIYRS